MKLKKIISTLFASILFAGTPTVAVAQAEDNTKKTLFNTSVLTDFSGMNLTDLFESDRQDVSLYSFQEFGFSETSSKDYNLYFYVHNPKKIRFAERDGASQINMAVKHDAIGKVLEYKNLRLRFLGYYDEDGNSVNDYKIAKFCLVDPSEVYADAVQFEQWGESRQYDIAGIQLRRTDEYPEKVNLGGAENTGSTIKDYDVSRTYFCEGYNKGYGRNEDQSTLRITSKALTTIKLDIHHTNYRPTTERVNYKGQYVYDDLQTAYFSIPEVYFEEYGGLQKIKCEYYHYITTPIFVIDESLDPNAYDYFDDYIGKTIDGIHSLNWSIYWGENNNIYNPLYSYPFRSDAPFSLNRIDWLFAGDKDGNVSRDIVENYANSYTADKSLCGTTIDVGTKKYSKKLFVDEDGTGYLMNFTKPYSTANIGYNEIEIDAGDKVEILTADNNFWNRIGLTHTTVVNEYNPIVVLTEDDTGAVAELQKETFCDEYLMNKSDWTEIKRTMRSAYNKNERICLFRFANTSYYQSLARYEYDKNFATSNYDGYVAQESVFLNFDVISLTFRSDMGAETVIGVVADPEDIFNGVEDKIGLPKKFNLLPFLMLIAVIILFVVIVKNFFRQKQVEHAVNRANKKKKRK